MLSSFKLNKNLNVLFHKNDRMPVIICKNDKHLVTDYNVIFSNMTSTLSQLSYFFYEH